MTARGHVAFFHKSASLGVFDREFRGKEQQEKPRVREFRELWIASLRGLSVQSRLCNQCQWDGEILGWREEESPPWTLLESNPVL